MWLSHKHCFSFGARPIGTYVVLPERLVRGQRGIMMHFFLHCPVYTFRNTCAVNLPVCRSTSATFKVHKIKFAIRREENADTRMQAIEETLCHGFIQGASDNVSK